MSHDNCEAKIDIFGWVTVWPKGQIVIPKDIRNQLNIQPWDKLISLIVHGKYLGLIRNEDMQELSKNIKI